MIMAEEREYGKNITGNTGITAGGNVIFGNITGQSVVGSNNVQNQFMRLDDVEELRKSLLAFQKGIAKLGLSNDDQNIVNGKISEAIKEAKKETPLLTKIKETFEGAINSIKDAGKTIKDISELYEPAKKIAKLVGIGLSFIH